VLNLLFSSFFILPSGRLCVSLYKEQDSQKLGRKDQEQFCEELLIVLDIDSSQRLDTVSHTVEKRVKELVFALFLCP